MLFVDNIEQTNVALLFTPFNFHFITGNPDALGIEDMIEQTIFFDYLELTGEIELIIFTPDQKWDKLLFSIFTKYKGIRAERLIFGFHETTFNKIVQQHQSNIEVEIEYEKENQSNMEYPIAQINEDKDCISFCEAFMLGNKHVEIDVFTQDEYRGQGLAKTVCIALIKHLLVEKYIPDWNAWSFRKSSHHLAVSLGFVYIDTVIANVWTESDCGAIEKEK